MAVNPNPTAIVPRLGKRPNKVPLMLAGGIGVMLMVALIYAAYTRTHQIIAPIAPEEKQAEGSKPAGFLNEPPSVPPIKREVQEDQSPKRPQPQQPQAGTMDDPRVQMWQEYYRRMAQLAAARDAQEAAAMTAATDVPQEAAKPQRPIARPDNPDDINAMITAVAGGRPQGPAAALDQGGDQGQAEKRRFMASGANPLAVDEDLHSVKHDPKPYTIMEGTQINLTALRGVTSDMPGHLLAQVDKPVCDSMTGTHLLIPQFAKITGHYDNSITAGQERIALLLDRVVFPDTSSLQLGGMEGADAAGYAGVKDQVDKHWTEKFLSATVIAIAGAAVQLAQPQQSAFSGYSPSSMATGALTQQYSQLGQEAARQGLSIPNTLTIRPGKPFTLAINKDTRLPEYSDARTGSRSLVCHG